MTKVSHDSETPAVGKQVITACAFIHHQFDGVEKVFLPKRADTKKFLPGVYELPGGHIDFGEHIVDGLKREIKEELQVDIAVGDPLAVFDYRNDIKGSHSAEIVYFATLISPPDAIQINPEDHAEYGWFAKDELHLTRSNRQNEADDPEYAILQKGFAVLEGASPDTVGQ